MNVSVAEALSTEHRDTVVIALAEGATVPAAFEDAVEIAALQGEVRTKPGHVAHLHLATGRLIVVGVGPAAQVTAEGIRVAAAHATARASALGSGRLDWMLPVDLGVDQAAATAAIVEGTLLRAWSYAGLHKADPDPDPMPDVLVVVGGDADAAYAASVTAQAANWARTQQHEPPNVLTPTELGARAKALAVELDNAHLEIEVEGWAEIEARGWVPCSRSRKAQPRHRP